VVVKVVEIWVELAELAVAEMAGMELVLLVLVEAGDRRLQAEAEDLRGQQAEVAVLTVHKCRVVMEALTLILVKLPAAEVEVAGTAAAAAEVITLTQTVLSEAEAEAAVQA
jgi:hypothetical protein